MRRATDWRHAKFAREFFTDCNAVSAYRRAGFKARTPGARRAGVSALLTNPNVQRHLAQEFARLQARLDLAQDRHALEVCRVAYSDMRALCTWGPEGIVLKPSGAISADAAAAVQRVKSMTRTRMVAQHDGALVPETDTRVEVTLYPKVPALALLATMFYRGEAVRQELEAKLWALAALAGKYVSREHHAEYLAEVRTILGEEVTPDSR